MTSAQSDSTATKETLPSQIQGSCLCGAVKFSIAGAPLMRILCHCVSCKKVSGSVFQANNCYSSSQLTISPLTVPNAIKTYVDNSPQSLKTVHRSFCSECGSRLWNVAPEYPDNIAVMVGVLDLADEDWKSWMPEREFFCKRKGDWLGSVGASAEGRTLEM